MTSNPRTRPPVSQVGILLLLTLGGCAVGKIATSPPQLDATNRNRLEVLMDETGAAARELRVVLSNVVQSGETGSVQRLGAQSVVTLTNLSSVLTTLTGDPRLPGAATNRLAAVLDDLSELLTNATALLTNVGKPTAQVLSNLSALAVSANGTATKASRLLDEAESLGAGLALRQGIIPSDYEFLFDFQQSPETKSNPADVRMVWRSVYATIFEKLTKDGEKERFFLEKQIEDFRSLVPWIPEKQAAQGTEDFVRAWNNTNAFGEHVHSYLTNLISIGVPIGGRPPLRISFLVQGNTLNVRGFSGSYSDYERDATKHFGPILPVAKEIQDLWRYYRDSPGRRHLRTFRIAPAEEFWDHPTTNQYRLDRVLSGAEPIRVIAEHSLVSLNEPSQSEAVSKFGLELNLAWDPAGEAVLSGTIFGFLGQLDKQVLRNFFEGREKESSAVSLGRIYAVRHNGDQSPMARP